MSNNSIKKQLKQRYNYIKSLGYNVLYITIKDNRNYNLDASSITNDCIAIVIPSIDYIIMGKKLISDNIKFNDNEHICLIDIRQLSNMLGEFDIDINDIYNEDVNIINKKYYNEVKAIMDNYIKQYYKSINIIVYSILKKELKDYISQDEIIDNTYMNINLDRYKNIYFTADTHFGHTNILKYCDRFSKLNIKTIEEHDNLLIEMWNNTVKEDDLVFILGDLCFYGPKKAEDLIRKLNGHKILIKGNHDVFIENKNFDKSLFEYIDDYMEINYRGQKIILMHYPIQSFKHMCKEEHSYLHFFGHIHNSRTIIPEKSCNVGVDVNEFKLISIKDAINKAKGNLGNQLNT